MKYLLFITLIFISFPGFSQKTRIINEGNLLFMKKVNNEWVFRKHLSDGRWIACLSKKDTSIIRQEAFFKNRIRNGQETHYNPNHTIHYQLTYINGVLNGPFLMNWSAGEPQKSGFYKNNLRNGLWTFYDNHGTDTFQITDIINYTNQHSYYVSSFNKKGEQTIKNGEGTRNGVPYKKGLRNGIYIETNNKNDTTYLNRYKNDTEVEYIRSYYRWSKEKKSQIVARPAFHEIYEIDSIPLTDTSTDYLDDYVWSITEQEQYTYYNRYKTGQWTKHHINGQLFFVGYYNKDKRIGIWNWYYPNGQKQLQADYTKSTMIHYDSTGQVKSLKPIEFISLLTSQTWYMNTSNYQKAFFLEHFNNNVITIKYDFQINGELYFVDHLECGKDISRIEGNWEIYGDTLTISIPDSLTNTYILQQTKPDKVIFREHTYYVPKLLLTPLTEL